MCGAPVQRIVYAENEANYCARCQTGGVVLADRALSRLLHKSFPRRLDDDLAASARAFGRVERRGHDSLQTRRRAARQNPIRARRPQSLRASMSSGTR